MDLLIYKNQLIPVIAYIPSQDKAPDANNMIKKKRKRQKGKS